MNKKKVQRVEIRSFSQTTNFFSNILIAIFAFFLVCYHLFFVIAISFTDESILSTQKGIVSGLKHLVHLGILFV